MGALFGDGMSELDCQLIDRTINERLEEKQEALESWVNWKLNELEESIHLQYRAEIDALQDEINDLRNGIDPQIQFMIEVHERDYDHDSL